MWDRNIRRASHGAVVSATQRDLVWQGREHSQQPYFRLVVPCSQGTALSTDHHAPHISGGHGSSRDCMHCARPTARLPSLYGSQERRPSGERCALLPGARMPGGRALCALQDKNLIPMGCFCTVCTLPCSAALSWCPEIYTPPALPHLANLTKVWEHGGVPCIQQSELVPQKGKNGATEKNEKSWIWEKCCYHTKAKNATLTSAIQKTLELA